MSRKVISVEHVWKQYRLGTVNTGMLGQDLKRWWYRKRGKEDPFGKVGENDRTVKAESDLVWALQDINFSLAEGEVLGIVGRNGAGKSTLLKLLSRVTAPTIGEIKIKGRVASLLEVGTGFHPELTGRENIFLNGTILGMRKAEIKSKFDEIVAFSGVERYIDTPVKRYSSGMYVRLAFAVAAHLEPEVLIVDEVLAVGDAEFQRKCLGKMKDVSGQGRTILFVSHNMAAVKTLCTKAILLKNGKVSMEGEVEDITAHYIKSQVGEVGNRPSVAWSLPEAPASTAFVLNSVNVKNSAGEISGSFYTSETVTVEIGYEVRQRIAGSRVLIKLTDIQGIVVFVSTNQLVEETEKAAGRYMTTCVIPKNILNGGTYYISVRIGKPNVNDVAVFAENVVTFGTILMGNNGSISQTQWPGVVAPELNWRTESMHSWS